MREIERQVEWQTGPEAEVVRGDCSAVRSALTDDGRPPLAASGLTLHDRLSAIGASRDRAKANRGEPSQLQRLRGMIERGLEATAEMWPSVRRAFGWVHRAAHALGLEETAGPVIRGQLGGLLRAMPTHRGSVGTLAPAVDHFVKVSRRY